MVCAAAADLQCIAIVPIVPTEGTTATSCTVEGLLHTGQR